jgi:hypothetical protein
MNNKQLLASEICGYSYKETDWGARADGYYDCKTKEEKLEFLRDYTRYAPDICCTEEETGAVYEFLETDFSGSSNAMHHAFDSL